MPNSFPDIAIVNGARTPMGRYCGKLRDFSAQELAAIASVEAMKRSGVDPAEIDHCVMGNAQQTSSDAIYGARHVALKAGVPIETPAITVNRLCGSGMQSVVTAAQMIQLGESKCVLAGGMESMSQAPHVIRGMRWGVGFGEGKLEDSLYTALTDSYCNLPMAVTAETYAGQQERHPPNAGRVGAGLAAARRRRLQSRAHPGRADAGRRSATSAASRPAKCSPKTTIAARKPLLSRSPN